MSDWAIIMAAGSGTRMGLGRNKVLVPVAGKSALERSVAAFSGLVDGTIVVINPEDIEIIRGMELAAQIVSGGTTRQQSVLAGLRALPGDADIVLIHDAARPNISTQVILRCLLSARTFGSGVASVPVKDTIKQTGAEGYVIVTPSRDALRAAQTPQAFSAQGLRQAIETLEARGETATDDAGAMEAVGLPVRLVDGDYTNIKLTTPEDMRMLEALFGGGGESRIPRVGHGFDVHRLVDSRTLILCGVSIPYEKGLLGHSDADVALHALMDALLGAAGLGDIGRHFPDTEKQYEGISSLLLLERVNDMLAERGFSVQNVDITIIAQRPKLRPYIDEMTKRTAHALGLHTEKVNIKATTTEGLGFEGEGLGISAHALAVIR